MEESGEDELERFNQFVSYLNEKNLFKTLDCFLEEYDTSFMIPEAVDLPKEDDSACIKTLKSTFSDLHSTSVLSINFDIHSPQNLLTTSSDKYLKLFSMDGNLISSGGPFSSPIISLAVNPVIPNLYAIGSMDFTNSLVQYVDGSFNVLKNWKIHTKYVIQVKWSRDGTLYAAASRDGSFTLYRLNLDTMESEMILHSTVGSCIEAIEFTKDSKHLIVTSRDDNYLHYINLETLKDVQLNMNSLGDDYVSFNVLDLNCSDDGSSLLVSTDKNRAILFQTHTPIQKRNFYGFLSDDWSIPRATFSNDNQFIYTTSQDNSIYAYAIQNEKLVSQITGHTGVVRDISVHPTLNILASCSYDKTVKLWEI